MIKPLSPAIQTKATLDLIDYLYNETSEIVETRILSVMAQLNIGSLNAINVVTDRGVASHTLEDNDFKLSGGESAKYLFLEYCHYLPTIDQFGNGPHAARISDSSHEALRHFAKTPLKDVFEKLGIQDALHIDPLGNRSLCFHLSSDRFFSNDDYALIQSLIPHFKRVYTDAFPFFKDDESCPRFYYDRLRERFTFNQKAKHTLHTFGIIQEYELGEPILIHPRLQSWVKNAQQEQSQRELTWELSEDQSLMFRLIPSAAHAGFSEITFKVERASPLNQLTPKERLVLEWVAQGKTNPEIAAILGIATATVRVHVENIRRKLGVETRGAAAAMLVERG